MRSSSIGLIAALGVVSFAFSACQVAESDSPQQMAGSGAVSGAAAGTGLPGTGGMAAGTPAAGTGVVAGSAGVAGTPASTGGIGGAVGTGGSAGMVSTGGSAGVAGAMPDAGAPDASAADLAMCVSDVMTSTPSTEAACASCMCTACGTELLALDGDTNANAMLSCISMNDCSGSCCLCNLPDCAADPNMFGAGPCGNEIQTAAGVAPMMGLFGAITNGGMVMTNCSATGPADQSCADAARLGECISTNCPTECPMTACE